MWNGRIPGTPIVVDNFSRVAPAHQHKYPDAAHPVRSLLGIDPTSGPLESIYFCTHAHTDHTRGLSANWDLGIIYCSQVTRALLLHQFPGGGLERRLRPLELDQTHTIQLQQAAADDAIEDETMQDVFRAQYDAEPPNSAPPYGAAAAAGASRKRKQPDSTNTCVRATSFTVQLFSSNHCPGSVMFVFRSSSWGTILHTGDFRYDPAAFHSASLHALIGQIDLMYFDATFLAQECAFTPKYQAIKETIKAIKGIKEKHEKEYRPPTPVGTTATTTAAYNSRNSPSPVPLSASNDPSSATCPPALDWRAYLCCEGLGSEDLLASVAAEFQQPFFVDESHPALKLRAAELRQLIRVTGDDTTRIVTDPRLAHTTHLHLASGSNFQRFAQLNRLERAEAKKQWRMEQMKKQALLYESTMHAYSFHPTPPPLPPSSSSSSAPHTIYIKPSTQWFIHRTRAAHHMTTTPGSVSGVLPLGSSYLSRGMRRTREEEEIAAYSDQASSAPTQMVARADDRYGVTHILYSMHSDCQETIDFIRFMRPRIVAPMNVPCCLQTERQEVRYAGSQGHSPSLANASQQLMTLGPCHPDVLSYIERLLRSRLPVEEVPQIKGTDFVLTPRQNELVRQQHQKLIEQIQRMKQFQAKQQQQSDTSETTPDGTETSSDLPPAAVTGVSAPPSEKRVKVHHPSSPFDTLGGGYLNSRWYYPIISKEANNKSATNEAPPPAIGRGPPRTLHAVSFDPKNCPALVVYLERDIKPIEFRSEIRARFEQLGCRVEEWKEPPMIASSIHSNHSSGAMDVDSGHGRQLSPIAPPPVPPPVYTLPSDVTLIILHLQLHSSRHLLLPLIVQYIEKLMTSAANKLVDSSPPISPPTRDWSKHPVFICTLDCLFWLESMNGHASRPLSSSSKKRTTTITNAPVDPHPPPPTSSPSSAIHPHPDRYVHWSDVCIWNSASKFERLEMKQSTEEK